MLRENGKLSISISPIGGNNFVCCLKFAKVDFIDERLDLKYKQFEAMKKESIGDDSPLLYNQIPVVVSPEGKTYAQTAACMQLLKTCPPQLSPQRQRNRRNVSWDRFSL